ncbi:hypothetical protein COI77_26025 [Bacillus thuringiensis]|nr:hypothetical protein CN351_26840 [Bacillus thuringiensis]PFI31128.1 hypothetical protein COI77_26025 [Bacillus thuringiensis]
MGINDMSTTTNAINSRGNAFNLNSNKTKEIINVNTVANNSLLRKLEEHDLTNSLKSLEHPISIIHEELEYLSNYIARPHSFIFSGPRGYILNVLNVNTDIDINIGESFNTLHMGINAIGLAKETNEMSVVIGNQHSSNQFWGYSCICTPIKTNTRTVGFLDLTFPETENITFAIPMMKQLAKNIEGEIIKLCPTYQQEKAYALFNNYNLTTREKEIAFGWLNNLSCEEIASINSISTHTVRTHIKHIYSKTNAFNKGDFVSKFKV